jgi:tetratricopeptide (TPR) repeat protein
MELGRAYEKEQNYQRAAEVREKIFRLYCRNGTWYKKLTRQESRDNADSVSEQAIELVARHYLYEAKQLGNATGEALLKKQSHLRKAISAYGTFLSIYPENPNRAKYNYQEAEAYYSLEDYGAAAKKYIQVSKLGDPKLRKASAYNAIVAAQEFLKQAEDGAAADNANRSREHDVDKVQMPGDAVESIRATDKTDAVKKRSDEMKKAQDAKNAKDAKKKAGNGKP